jgi:peptidoglycan/LPS O-acetylase OafA/YrhL
MGRNNLLDCIRALAAFLVLARHSDLLSGGGIGVSLFFCLSGYLIATILLDIKAPIQENLKRFVFRRFMRIWPLMFVQIAAAAILLALLMPENLEDYLQSVPGLLTFLTPEGLPFQLSRSVLWTLQAEFWFYIFMAAFVFVAGPRPIAWFAVFGIAIAWLVKFNILPIPLLVPMRQTILYFDQLMIGVLCACAVRSNGRLVTKLFSSRSLGLWMPFAVIAALSTLEFKGHHLVYYFSSSAAAYLTGVIILHQWARPLKGDYEPLATLGRVSYSIYLMHALVFEFVSWHLFPAPLQFLFVSALTIVISMVTYRWIEMPFVQWSKRRARWTGHQDAVAV